MYASVPTYPLDSVLMFDHPYIALRTLEDHVRVIDHSRQGTCRQRQDTVLYIDHRKHQTGRDKLAVRLLYYAGNRS